MTLLSVSIACGVPATPTETSTADGNDTSTTDPATTLPLPDPSATSTTSASATTSGSSDVDSTGVDFIVPPDATHPFPECDIEAQDCPRGFKCMPYSSQGDSWWDATACFPVDPDPVGLGEPCEWQGKPWSGVDDCGFAQVCFSFEPGDGGVCKGLCLFEDPENEWSPTCEDPAAVPYIGCQTCFCWCETQCDPLVQGCGDGQMCVASNDFFMCTPDASGDMGAYGDSCEFINACDPGLTCVAPSAVPGCEGATGCCTPFCDLTQPNVCPGAAEGQECVPWFEAGQAPPGLENVGACALPA